MSPDPIEHVFTCPYCWEEITMVLEPRFEEQAYIEDCEVCCRPIEVRFRGDADGLAAFEALDIEQ